PCARSLPSELPAKPSRGNPPRPAGADNAPGLNSGVRPSSRRERRGGRRAQELLTMTSHENDKDRVNDQSLVGRHQSIGDDPAEGVTKPTYAAGAVLWRGDADDPEVGIIHRPSYGDWSLPKGK